MGANTYMGITASMYDITTGATYSDYITVPVVVSSATTITPVLTNEYHLVPVDNNGGVISLAGSGTSISSS